MKKSRKPKNRTALERERERATLLEKKEKVDSVVTNENTENEVKASNKIHKSENSADYVCNARNIKNKIKITPRIAMPIVLMAILLVCFIVLKNNTGLTKLLGQVQQL